MDVPACVSNRTGVARDEPRLMTGEQSMDIVEQVCSLREVTFRVVERGPSAKARCSSYLLKAQNVGPNSRHPSGELIEPCATPRIH